MALPAYVLRQLPGPLPLDTVGRGSTSGLRFNGEGINQSEAMFKVTMGWSEAVGKG